MSENNDAPSIGFAGLGFFIPLVGLILFLVWRKDRPQKAKFCGIGALVGAALSVIVLVIRLVQPVEGTDTVVKKTKEFYYEGLSFSYPSNWRAPPETVTEDLVFSVICKKFGISNTDQIVITWIHSTNNDPLEFIEDLMETYTDMFPKTEFSEFYSDKIGEFDSISTDFVFSLIPELPFSLPIPIDANLYGTISSFASDEYTVLFVKITDKKKKLFRAEFQLIKDSIEIR